MEVLFSCPVMSDVLQPHGLQHARPPYASPSPGVCPSSCSLHWWWHPQLSLLFRLNIHLILWYLCLLLPSIFLIIRDFSNESSVCIRWPKYWSFSISIGPSRDYSGLISLKIGWFDLFAVQGTFRNLLQHHSSKTSILWRSAFFTVQLSQLYMTIGKDYSFDYMDLCQQRNVSAFQDAV